MDHNEVDCVVRVLDLVSSFFSSMTAMIDKERIRMDQKYEKKMRTIRKKAQAKLPKRRGSGYNLFVSTNVKKSQSVQVAILQSLVV